MKRNITFYELEILAMVWAIGVFQHYLYKPFTVMTDNKAMTWLRTKRECPNKRITQWVINLEQFEFQIKHRTSKQNANADGPSRFNVMGANESYGEKVDLTCSLEISPTDDETHEHIEPDYIFCEQEIEVMSEEINAVMEEHYELPGREELIRAQRQDKALNDIVKHILNNFTDKDYPFFLREGLLMKRTANPHKFKRKVARKFRYYEQIMIPDNEKIKEAIFFLNHDHIMAAHGGFARIVEKVEEKYFWKSMKKDLKRHTKMCLKCAKRKTPRPLRNGLTQSLEAKYVMHKFAFDIVTNLPHLC